MVAEILVSEDMLDLPRINLALPGDRTVQAVRSLIDVKGHSGVRMQHNPGEHGVYVEDTLIYRTAA
jgi:hypothetical protein